MDYKTISYDLDDKGIAIITLNRPKALNAVSGPMFEELTNVLEIIAASSEVRAVILTGEGRAFCAGGDLAEMQQGYGGNAGFYHHMERANRCTAALVELNKPVIAAVNGVATGAGMNLVLACDIAIASNKVKFSEIFGNVGLVPDVGGTWLLSRVVGRAKAKEIVFSYRMIEAQEALELGLVSRLVEPDQVMEAAYALAEKIAQGPTFAFAMAKAMIDRSYETDLRTALQMEALSQALAGNSEDHREGVDAFFGKRPHQFRGN